MASAVESNELHLFQRALDDSSLNKAMQSIIGADSHLLFVDRLSPLALFVRNLPTLIAAIPELKEAQKRFVRAMQSHVMKCRLLEPIETGQVWKARRTYLDNVSVTRLHCADQGRMVGISVEALYLAHTFLVGARDSKPWPLVGQAELTERFAEECIAGTTVPLCRLQCRDTVVDPRQCVRVAGSPILSVVDSMAEAPRQPASSNGGRGVVVAAAAANDAAQPKEKKQQQQQQQKKKKKHPTFNALHAYMTHLATMTTRVDPMVHGVYVAMENPLFGHWLQQSNDAAAMLRANNNEARDVTKRAVPGDLWWIVDHGATSDNVLQAFFLQNPAEASCAKDADTVVHAMALTQLTPLTVQIDAIDFCMFISEFVETTLRVSSETDDCVA